MRKYPISVLFLLCLASCLSEKNVDLAKPTTFIRYYGDGYNNDAIAIEEVSDPEDKGFIILANSTIQDSEADVPMNRIVLIKTNEFGDEQWRKYYPDGFLGSEKRWVANSITLLSGGGYLIAGDEIQGNVLETRKALVMKVEADGNGLISQTYSAEFGISADVSISGRGIVELPSDNFVLLATSPVDSDNDATHLAEISSTLSNTTLQWSRTYTQGKAEIKNKLYFVNGTIPYLYWAGNTQQFGSSVDGFVTQSELNAAATENGQTDIIGGTLFNDFAGDFCPRGGVFGYVGSTDENDGGDIVFYQVNGAGHAFSPVVYRKGIFTSQSGVTDDTNNKKETANAIAPTNDSGYIILGTIDTYTNLLGRGNTDLLLLKIDGAGGKQWSKPYGSIDADLGASIRQVSDGGYAVLGTSRVAGQRTILLIKTDNRGEIQ